MSWVCELTGLAQDDLRDLPIKIQSRFSSTMAQMERDPFLGNVKPLRGSQWKGVYRCRIGSYRILFKPDFSKNLVLVLRILIRSEKTYR